MAANDEPGSSFIRKCRPRKGGYWRHGLSDSRLETIYERMMARCHNPNAENFPRYGARAITVCSQWRANPGSFYSWALANGYRDDLQIDRKDNSLGYSPQNCRWVTRQDQQNNRTNNRRVVFAGLNLTIAEWSRKTGIGRTTIEARLARGLAPADAFRDGRVNTEQIGLVLGPEHL